MFFDTSWQDLLAMVSGALFSGAAIPTIRHQMKARASTIPVSTSLVMGTALALVIPVYISFGLWIGTALLATQFGLWSVILVQRVLYKEG